MFNQNMFSDLNYTVPVDRLSDGHSYGNCHVYLSLDSKADVKNDQSMVRYGLRDSLNQQYYLLGWEVSLHRSDGKTFSPIRTTFTPVYQKTLLQIAHVAVSHEPVSQVEPAADTGSFAESRRALGKNQSIAGSTGIQVGGRIQQCSSDTVVARDSVWYLMGSSFYAQPWSRKLLDLWFAKGLDVNGKFTEYMSASRDPFFKDDYGLNINDGTPLYILAAFHYYALSKDRDFLLRNYSSLLNSANFILEQRKIGINNRFNLVWCSSTETFLRGLCGWRNAIRDFNLSGAVTEVNAECYYALKKISELAKEVGDPLNQERLETAAEDLRKAINQHLRSSTKKNPYYYLNISPAGDPVDDLTGDILFQVLFEIADSATSLGILQTLFSDQFWVSTENGGGGIRTVSSKEKKYTPRADPDTYGLMGSIWPNVAL